MIYSRRASRCKKVPTERLVDELFAEIDRYYAAGKRVVRDEAQRRRGAAPGSAENEDADAMTPERIAALEAAAARAARRGRVARRGPALHAER